MNLKDKKPVKFAIFAMLAFVILACSLFFFLSSSTTSTLKQDHFQIGAGIKMKFEVGTRLTFEENKTTFNGAEKNASLSSAPLYAQDMKSFLLPRDLIFVNARQKQFFRADHFTTFDMDDQDVSIDETLIQKGFLYDGNQQYVFLEAMTLDMNGKQKELSVGSSIYVNADSKAYILYDRKSDDIEVGNLYSNEIAALCNDYKVDLLNGILMIDDEKILLYSRSEDLDRLK